MNITKEQLIELGVSQDNSIKYVDFLNKTLEKYQINTPLRVSNFLAQCLHESGNFKYTKELADGKAYEGRSDMGNTHPGDGPLFKGRGFLQLTWRPNYTSYGKYIGQDLITGNNADKVSLPELASDSAGWFWEVYKRDKDGHSLNYYADLNNFFRITYSINGGFNGVDDRFRKLKKCFELFDKPTYQNNIDSIIKYVREKIFNNTDKTPMQKLLSKTIPDEAHLQEFLKK